MMNRAEEGVIKKGMSLLKVKNGVDFYQTEKKVYLFFASHTLYKNVVGGENEIR